MKGLHRAVLSSPENSLVLVFTDASTKDMELLPEIAKVKRNKGLTVYIVLAPTYRG